jgi:hypothetical protein
MKTKDNIKTLLLLAVLMIPTILALSLPAMAEEEVDDPFTYSYPTVPGDGGTKAWIGELAPGESTPWVTVTIGVTSEKRYPVTQTDGWQCTVTDSYGTVWNWLVTAVPGPTYNWPTEGSTVVVDIKVTVPAGWTEECYHTFQAKLKPGKDSGGGTVGSGTGVHFKVCVKQPTQACCLPDGTCIDTTVSDCVARNGLPQGPGTNCATTVCPQPTQACCLPDGTCIDITVSDCVARNGLPQGPGTNCATTVCPQPTQACCLPDGSCVDVDPSICRLTGGIPQGLGTNCDMVDCPEPNLYEPFRASWKYYIKWSQLPVEIEPISKTPLYYGWDEQSIYSYPPIVADDWLCQDERPITGIHWWGSFKGWNNSYPPPVVPKAFHIGIWTDIPAGVDGAFSHPGDLIWENYCDNWVWNLAGYDEHPSHPEKESCFQFTQLLSQNEWFYQEPNDPWDGDSNSTVYWLSIAAIYDTDQQPQYLWGWNTRPHFFQDNAVRIRQVEMSPLDLIPGSPIPPWPPQIGAKWLQGEPIVLPDGVSWDMAFELTTNEPGTPCADLNGDGIVNFKDFVFMAEQWLQSCPF